MQDLTQGSIRAHVLRMMLFMLVGMLTQTLYSLVDIYWVARLGKEAVAAVSVSSNLMFVVLAISQALGVGAAALISQAFGGKDEARAQRLFNQSQSLCLFTGLLFLLLASLAAPWYARSLASNAATAALVEQFLAWFIPAMALQFSMVGLGAGLRGIGNMKVGLVAQVGSVLLNMLLAPLLIFGWGTGHPLGVAGAGLATFLATAVTVAALVFYVAGGRSWFRYDTSQWRPDFAAWRRMLAIGLPAGAEFLIMTVILSLIFIVIRPFGAEAQAGFGIGMRVMQAGFMPAVALSFAAAAVAGQNFGAQRLDRVRETFIEGAKLNIGFMLVFTALCQIAPASLMRLFSQDPTVVAVGADYLRYVSFNYVASGLILIAAGVFQGLGNTLPSLLSSASRLLTFVLPVWLLAPLAGFNLHQVWITSALSVTLQMVLSLLLLHREFGRRMLPVPGVAV